jgi:hypothetical protein
MSQPEHRTQGSPDIRPGRTGGVCFSYSDGVPLGVRNRDAAQRALRDLPGMPAGACFSYSARVPLSVRRVTPTGHGSGCFSYSDGMPPGNRPRLPEGKICFSY